MLALATKDEPDFEIDSRELSPGASPYTVDTLATLHADRPGDEFYLLLGADQHAAFRRWHRPAEVKRLARLAVFTRPGFQMPAGDAHDRWLSPLPDAGTDNRAPATPAESAGEGASGPPA